MDDDNPGYRTAATSYRGCMCADPAETIDRLYRVFATVPRPPAIEYCDCCFTAAESRALLQAVPVRDLPVEALRPYADLVLLTVGDVADYRYFLPRLLEIGFAGDFCWPDLEPLVGRLAHATWLSWSDTEVRAVRDVLMAEWASTLASDPDAADIDSVLCAIGSAEEELGPYLAYWTARLDRPTAAAQLLALLRYGIRPVGAGRRMVNAFWGGRADQVGQVTAWLASSDLRTAVAEAFAATDAEQHLETLSDIDGLLDG
jgi:hypothetical protein